MSNIHFPICFYCFLVSIAVANNVLCFSFSNSPRNAINQVLLACRESSSIDTVPPGIDYVMSQSAECQDDDDGPLKMDLVSGQHSEADNRTATITNAPTPPPTTTTSVKRKNTSTTPHADCAPRTLNETSTLGDATLDTPSVQLVNGSHLTALINEAPTDRCFLVMIYVPWCKFSTRLAPMYNSLPRAFANIDILAFDVSTSIGYDAYANKTIPSHFYFYTDIIQQLV